MNSLLIPFPLEKKDRRTLRKWGFCFSAKNSPIMMETTLPPNWTYEVEHFVENQGYHQVTRFIFYDDKKRLKCTADHVDLREDNFEFTRYKMN